jgi:CBS domain-containing protein
MRVRDCMSVPVQVIGPDAPAWEAVGLMRRGRIRRLPVVENGALVGIITWTDVVRVQPPAVGGQWQIPNLAAGIHVRHLMTPSPLAVHPDLPVHEAAALMRRHKIGGLPVVDDSGLVGIITESDVFDVFAEMFRIEPGEVRLHVAVGSVSVELPRIVAALARAGVPIVSLQVLRARGAEGVYLVIHDRDQRRARDIIERLALQTSLEDAPALPVRG